MSARLKLTLARLVQEKVLRLFDRILLVKFCVNFVKRFFRLTSLSDIPKHVNMSFLMSKFKRQGEIKGKLKMVYYLIMIK
jgi:hypothetical protein